MNKSLFYFGLLILAVLGSTSVYAAGELGAAGSEDVSAIIQAIFKKTSSLVDSGPFQETGKSLMYMLLGILISWKGIKIALDFSGFNQVIAEIVQIILLAGIAGFFMMPVTQQQLAKGFDQLAAEAASKAGGAINVTDPTSAIASTMATTFMAAEKLWDGPNATNKPAKANQGTWDKVTSFLTEAWTSISTGEMFLGLAAIIYRAFIAFCVVATALLYMVNLIMSQVMVNIGLILAPIFVPWILWESTAFLFQGWVKFMVVTGVQKIVGALLFGITASMVDNVTSIVDAGTASASLNFYAYSAAFLIVGIMAMMMMSVTSIANGLVSGMPTSKFEPPKAMSPGGMMGRGGGGTTGSQMKSAGSTAARAGGGAVGGAIGGAIGGFKAGGSGAAKFGGAVSGAAKGGFGGFKDGMRGSPSSGSKSTPTTGSPAKPTGKP